MALARPRADEAEQELYSRFFARVRSFGRRHLRDDAQAADFAQNVMLAVIQGLRAGRLREVESIGGYVLGTCRRMLFQKIRELKRDRGLSAALTLVTRTDVAPAEVGDRHRLAECLERLPMRDRTVILLTFYGDRSADEIAAELELTPENVRVIRHRALGRLEAMLEAKAS
jgi:RNA polymerase sigma-70 factor, ECF subfamily